MYKMPNMSKIPNLPLGNYYDKYPSREKFSRSQTLGYFNGYAIQRRPTFTEGLSEQELSELVDFTPTITYPQSKGGDPTSKFVPGYVAWDKKVLRFKAWFKESVLESPVENYRVRPVDILYYMVDDSMAVVEPVVENSGIAQGKFVSRHRIPKNELGDPWKWSDLNVGIEVPIYGRVFRIYDCDAWTRDFLESEGYAVNPPQECPVDPYTKSRNNPERPKSHKEQTDAEKLKQFLQLDGKVLRFYCVLDERDVPFGDIRKVILHYYLANDTIEIVEVRRFNDGRDPFPLLMSRQKVPKDPAKVQPPSLNTLGQRGLEKAECFGPRDFAIGKTVEMCRRKFLIYDCDEFTKGFYWKNFGLKDFTALKVDKFGRVITAADKMPLRDRNGESTDCDNNEEFVLEKLIPQPPKGDVIRAVDGEGIVLRYEATLDSQKAEDKDRRFVISYRVADDLMSIFEPPKKNSGFVGGRFLEKSRVSKPGSDPKKPTYYEPTDFYVGAVVDVFRHRFIITDADQFVLNYMQLHPDKFPADVVRSFHEIQNKSRVPNRQKYDDHLVLTKKPRNASEMADLIAEVKTQLKKLAITGNTRKDRVFLGVDVGRYGYVTRENIREMCLRQQLPCDKEITDAIAKDIGADPDHITLEEFRKFLETN